MNRPRYGSWLLGFALIPLISLTVGGQGLASGDKPVGVRILIDLELFPKEPTGSGVRMPVVNSTANQQERPDVLKRLTEFSRNPSSQRAGHASTAVMPGYSPKIDAIMQKYGKPDRTAEEPRDLGDAPDRVYYWGSYGFAVLNTDKSGQVAWVTLRIR